MKQPKSRAAQKLRRLAERVVKLDPSSDDFPERLESLQSSAQAILEEKKVSWTPENLAYARQRSIVSRGNRRRRRIQTLYEIVQKIREDGFTTYTAIARELNNRGISPSNGQYWIAGSVWNIEHEYDRLFPEKKEKNSAA